MRKTNNQKRKGKILVTVVGLMLLGLPLLQGCGDPGTDLCEEASAHLASCGWPSEQTRCNPLLAGAVLNQDCATLAAALGGGKADAASLFFQCWEIPDLDEQDSCLTPFFERCVWLLKRDRDTLSVDELHEALFCLDVIPDVLPDEPEEPEEPEEPGKQEGDSCASNSECHPLVCRPNYGFGPDSHTCQQKGKRHWWGGDSCDHEDGDEDCEEGLYCPPAAAIFNSACQ